ncbi:hypothetical protein J2Z83_000324 [Virgibacillus natechei]|uniref:Peptidyl-prolyl cis-trans isomerase n=1 Tax=Virgibacillus natechei TaxID=1216297 RepID=A0ABS4IBC6_9BACI|nr:hypothetical protein [Virgibacillus natechei]MBP1968232.1 hypothetical protein [Virgibacillus natechei]UZD14498.1 hypothetical protein OLD84_08390 [Virgibacillus natechei]
MIVPITGNVTYSITLDPTVWIFDDRKILFEEAFTEKVSQKEPEDELKKAAERWGKEYYHHQHIDPPVNKSISRFEGEKILKNSYVMPIKNFLDNAEIHSDSKEATIVTKDGDVTISIHDLQNSYFLFSLNGKPLKEDGPVHLYYTNGSNKEDPIKNVSKVIIN